MKLTITRGKRKKRVGRGGAKRGTSGRGTKGQKSRAGHRIRPIARDIIAKLPKLRGHNKNRARGVHDSRPNYAPINVSILEGLEETVITPKLLVKKGLARTQKEIKILGGGDIKRAVNVYHCLVSATAEEKIKKAGGEVKVCK